MTEPAKIELERVTRRYRIGEVTVTALEDVSLTVAGGEFTVILGPSGSGKTTLLNVIGALDSPTSGRLVVGGRDITQASRRSCFASAARRSDSSFRASTSSPA